jgi:hypothetical protein
MIENPYSVGDTVLASRSDDGEHYEEAKVVDAYSLIMGGDERPMVCVQFADGQRAYLGSDTADVKPLPESDEADAMENPPGSEDRDS